MSLLTEQTGRVLRITLNRPEKRNALTQAMAEELVRSVEQAQEEAGIGAILIDAEGPVFCAGMDLDEATSATGTEQTQIHERLFSLGRNARKPLVIAVAGPALGGGLGLVAQGHVVLGAQTATFAMPEIRIGMWPFVIWRSVTAKIGESRALELSLTGRVFSVHDALHWGLVHQVVPTFEADARALTAAHNLANSSPYTLALAFEYLLGARGLGWEESGALALQVRERLMQSQDFLEGCAAHKAKRNPRWPSMIQKS